MKIFKIDEYTVIDGFDTLLMTKNETAIEVSKDVENLHIQNFTIIGKINKTLKDKINKTFIALKFIWR